MRSPYSLQAGPFADTCLRAVFISVAQSVLTNKLASGLTSELPNLDASKVLAAGATSFRSTVPQSMLPAFLRVYNDAIIHTFYVGLALGCLSMLGSLLIEWKRIAGKEQKPPPPKPKNIELDSM